MERHKHRKSYCHQEWLWKVDLTETTMKGKTVYEIELEFDSDIVNSCQTKDYTQVKEAAENLSRFLSELLEGKEDLQAHPFPSLSLKKVDIESNYNLREHCLRRIPELNPSSNDFPGKQISALLS
jgi:hypothetical protein